MRGGCGKGFGNLLRPLTRLHLESFLQTYFLPVIGLVDAEKLKPGDLVVSGAPEPRQNFSGDIPPTKQLNPGPRSKPLLVLNLGRAARRVRSCLSVF